MDGNGLPDPRIERMRDPEGAHSQAWATTLEEMEVMADDRRSDGWEVRTVMAAHTDTVTRDMREHDRFGLTHIIPNNHVDAFRDFWDPDEFTEYLIYANAVHGFMYTVIELIDPVDERSIFLATRYDMTMAKGMVDNAKEEGVLYSHVKSIDGTILASIPYEEFEPLVTHPDR